MTQDIVEGIKAFKKDKNAVLLDVRTFEEYENQHINGSINITGWRGSFDVTQWLVAWPCAFRLEVLRKCGNWNLLDGKGQRGA